MSAYCQSQTDCVVGAACIGATETDTTTGICRLGCGGTGTCSNSQSCTFLDFVTPGVAPLVEPTDPSNAYAVCMPKPSASTVWDVFIFSAAIDPTDPAGQDWDAFAGAPDPFTCVAFSGSYVCTSSIQDTFAPQWSEFLAGPFRFDTFEAQQEITIFDEDITSNDTISDFLFTITPSTPGLTQSYDIDLTPIGGASDLVLVVLPG